MKLYFCADLNSNLYRIEAEKHSASKSSPFLHLSLSLSSFFVLGIFEVINFGGQCGFCKRRVDNVKRIQVRVLGPRSINQPVETALMEY